MNKVPYEDIKDDFPAQEGEANLYYGLIRSGKTYGATADIHEEIAQGHVVYATWPIFFKDEITDDTKSFWFLLRNLLFFKKRFYKIYNRENFHYIDAETGQVDGVQEFNPKKRGEYIEYLNKLNHCSLYIDEAWRVIDSYQKTEFSEEGRNLILVTGHKFRTVNLISQRPMGIHITARGNMSRFYKFVKISNGFWLFPPRFRRYEFQEMQGENVDETAEPISVKTYWGKKKIFESYNSWYYGELEPLHKAKYEAYDLSFWEKVMSIVNLFKRKK